MEALKLLIADSNEDFRLTLAQVLQKHYYVRCCTTGNEALELLRREKPEVFVLDLMLPELDGITLLEQIIAEGIRPMVLVITSMVTDYVFESAERLGIGYVMRKPCTAEAAAVRVRDLSHRLKPAAPKPEPDHIVREMLHSLGISTKYDGYSYLMAAIVLKAKDPRQALTKELYPAVAKVCGCQTGQIERSIRNAIEKGWLSHSPAWQSYFPGHRKRPSNGVLIARLAEELRQALE